MTAPRCTVCRHRGNRSSSRGRAGTRERGSVDQRCTASAGAATSRLARPPTPRRTPARRATSVPVIPSRTPPARQAPRVAAANAARAETRAARGAVAGRGAHRRPRIRCRSPGCPSRKRVARLGMLTAPTGSARAARSAPRRCAYMPSLAAPQRVEIGLHAGDHAPRPEPGGLVGGDHLQVFEPVPAARHRGQRRIASTTRSSASTTAATAASPMTWKPAGMPRLRCRRARWAAIASPSRYAVAAAVGRVVVRARAATRCASPARRRRTDRRPARARRCGR